MNTAAYLFVIFFFTADGTNVGATSIQANSKQECAALLEYATIQADARKNEVKVLGGCYKDLGKRHKES